MKDKKIFKKWWFWAIVAVVILGAIGSLGQNNTNSTSQTNSSQQASTNDKSTLPKLNTDDDYKGKEGLVVYKELQGKGYRVEAAFEKQALTDINGKASDVFAPLDANRVEDRQSVDAFVVGDVSQDGDSVKLSIIQAQSN